MSRPIVHGTALVPLLRFPRGGDFHLAIVMDEDLDLDTHAIAVRLRSRNSVERPVFLATEDGTGITKSGQTATIRLSPDLADETEDSDLTLAALQLQSGNAYRVDFLDGDGDLALRLQGDLDWLPEEGAWDDEPASVSTLPTINVALSNGAISVTVALVTQGGGSVDNAAVVEAIEEDPAAARTALGLGSAAEEDAEAFAAADDARLSDARTPTAHKTSHATGGSDALSPADIGAATSAQGAAADLAKAVTDFLTVTAATDLDSLRTKVAGLDSAIVLQGTWDASAGTFPGAGAAQAGNTWRVSAAGTVDGVAFNVGDRVMAIVDNASTTTFAANWFHEDYTDRVESVAGLVGAITASALRTALNVADGATAFNPAAPGPIGGTTPSTGEFTSITVGDAESIDSLADTWDDSGTTFEGIRLNVTDTASAAASMLLNLLIGGTSRFNVRKDGQVTTTGDIILGNGVLFKNAVGQNFFYFDWANNLLCYQHFQPINSGTLDLGQTGRRWRKAWIDATITAGGTTGAQTIDKAAGSVNFAAAATSVVVTNSLVSADSIILCTVRTNDATLKSVQAVGGAGSFTMHANAAATGETRVDFLVIN